MTKNWNDHDDRNDRNENDGGDNNDDGDDDDGEKNKVDNEDAEHDDGNDTMLISTRYNQQNVTRFRSLSLFAFSPFILNVSLFLASPLSC